MAFVIETDLLGDAPLEHHRRGTVLALAARLGALHHLQDIRALPVSRGLDPGELGRAVEIAIDGLVATHRDPLPPDLDLDRPRAALFRIGVLVSRLAATSLRGRAPPESGASGRAVRFRWP